MEVVKTQEHAIANIWFRISILMFFGRVLYVRLFYQGPKLSEVRSPNRNRTNNRAITFAKFSNGSSFYTSDTVRTPYFQIFKTCPAQAGYSKLQIVALMMLTTS